MSRCVDHKVDSAEDLKQISINPNDGTSFLWDLCSISNLFASKVDPVETVVEKHGKSKLPSKTEQIYKANGAYIYKYWHMLKDLHVKIL